MVGVWLVRLVLWWWCPAPLYIIFFLGGPGFRTLSVSMVVSNLGRYLPPAEAPNRGASRAAGRPNMEPADGHVPPFMSGPPRSRSIPLGALGKGVLRTELLAPWAPHPNGVGGHPGGTWAHLSA